MKSALAALAAIGSLAQPAQADEEEFTVPPYEGVYQPSDRDERGLWAIADEHERVLRDSDIVIRDPDLNAYVRSVLCRTVGEERCGSVRIYILRLPAFNASMTPNGTMRVYSGLLLRVRSEAELASILGHEFAHFELRHGLHGYRNRRSGSDLLAWTSLLGAAAARYGSGGYGGNRDMQFAIIGDVYRFQRDQEHDADLLGFAYMSQAGYTPSASAEVWRAVMNEADSTSADRGRKSRRYKNVSFFATHPTNLDRADRLSALANRVRGGDFQGFASHREAMEKWIPLFLADELAMNDFGGTDYLIGRLAGEEYTADLLYARGELYRGRGHPRDLEHAADFYAEALALDPEKQEAWRGLGLSLLRTGARQEAGDALRNYLEAVPDAEDAAMLRMLIQE